MFDYFDPTLDGNPHDRGYDDACEGLDLDECPFDPGTWEHDAWIAGWQAGQDFGVLLPPAPELDDLLLEAS